MFVLEDSSVFGEDNSILLAGRCNNDLIRRVIVERRWQYGRTIGQYRGKIDQPEFGQIKGCIQPVSRITGNRYPSLLQKLAKFPGRNCGQEEFVVLVCVSDQIRHLRRQFLRVHVPPDPGMGIEQIFHLQASHISSPRGETMSFSKTRQSANLPGLGSVSELRYGTT